MHQILNLKGSEAVKQDKEPNDHGSVASARDDECFARGQPVYGVFVPETDEKVTAQANAFPSEIEQQKIVGQHENHHGGDKQIHVREEPGVTLVLLHEFGGVQMDEKAHEGHDHDHQQ